MIHNPQSGGIHLPTLTNPAGAGQILSGYQAIDAEGNIIVGTIPSQGAQTITPGTANKTIAAGRYLSGTQTIAGDSDLIGSNIKSGVNLFRVAGTLAGMETTTLRAVDTFGSEATLYYCDGTDSFGTSLSSTEQSFTVLKQSILVLKYSYQRLGVSPSLDAQGLASVSSILAFSQPSTNSYFISTRIYFVEEDNPTISIS